ncbi:MAG: hypothetical protein QM791_09180 [Ferruginibacter sp.]
MPFLKRILLFVLITFSFLLGCRYNTFPGQAIERFNNSKMYLDEFVSSLRSDPSLDSIFRLTHVNKLPPVENSYPEIFKLLKDVGITEAASHQNICKICPGWYYLKTNWSGNDPVYLIYNFSDTAENVKGFYKKDDYGNETWGLGDQWKMFRFVKTIDPKY